MATAFALALPEIELRKATFADAATLLRWRNDPVTRAMSLSNETVRQGDHLAWLSRVLADSRRQLLVGVYDGYPIGTARIDRGGETEISWTIAPEWRGCGFCSALIAAAVPDGHVVARIKVGNIASQHAAARNGFRRVAAGPVERWERH